MNERSETRGDGAGGAGRTAGAEVPDTQLGHALALADMGFWVFPLVGMGKTPAFDGWQNAATRDRDAIQRMWTCPVTGWSLAYNVGIFTTKFGDGHALLVVDVDVKDGKPGDASVLELELKGFDLGSPLVALTPTGGRHLFYVVDAPVRQRAGLLPGVDIRSRGGYVVGAGSVVPAGVYVWA